MTGHEPKKTSNGNYKCTNCGRYATSKDALAKTPCRIPEWRSVDLS